MATECSVEIHFQRAKKGKSFGNFEKLESALAELGAFLPGKKKKTLKRYNAIKMSNLIHLNPVYLN